MMIRGFVVCVKEREKERVLLLSTTMFNFSNFSLFIRFFFFNCVSIYTYVCIFNMNSFLFVG